ncbi:FecR family protein [Persicitalea jodogahamensis]|uniref:FecR family protein n=1 Tax=Persicitalea jodogahamensis TaxID=402147 RepID=A0A8J3D9U2_9BACT|nr:FecR family protein [Persicitalea jodogahamensis]GHB65714.1 hypothetical protein GCM10007390_19790 [Persicitalea jodogahamensis]
MQYSDFKPNEFIEDARFKQWVRHPNAELDAFWRDFLTKHPEKRQDIITATNFLLGIEQQVEEGSRADLHEDVVFGRIRQSIADEPAVPIRQLPRRIVWLAAACILLLLGYFLIPPELIQSQEVSYNSNRRHSTVALIEKVNDSGSPVTVALADGSTVVLQPGSRISYAQNFTVPKNREVYLSGEAFFEVAKNPDKPFLVFANELVTKVLGTSFNVRAYQKDKDVTVEVRTGRVSVAVDEKIANQKEVSTREREGILLLPNQQAVLARKEIRLVKSLVKAPILLSDLVPDQPHYSFVFEAVPATQVFKTFELAYGLEIVFDKDLFDRCLFTGDLTDMPPYEKLELVCRSIEASYRILDAQILIAGKGCEL